MAPYGNSSALLLVIIIFIIYQVDSLQCRVDDTQPLDDPNNLYKCSDTETCCKDSRGPSCCAAPALFSTVEKQMKIWGGIFGAVAAVIFIICCCRKTYTCCCEKSSQKKGYTKA